MKLIALGIDPSPTSTGFVVLQALEKTKKPLLLHKAHTKSFAKKKGHERQSLIAGDMLDLLNKYHPDKVVIENYGLNLQHKSSIVPLVELGGLLRYFIVQMGYAYYSPRPGQHKEFISGNGQSNKDKVRAAVKSRFQFDDNCDDIVDAYGFAVIGLAQGGMLLGLTAREREIMGALTLHTCNQ